MPPRLTAYLAAVILAGTGLVAFNLSQLAAPVVEVSGWLERAGWLALLMALSSFPIVSTSGGGVSTLNSAINYNLLLSFGAAFAAPAVVLNSFVFNGIRRRAAWYKVLFNAGQLAISLNLADLLYRLCGGQPGTPPDLRDPLSLPLLAIPFVVVLSANILLVSVAVRLERGTPLLRQWRGSHYGDPGGNVMLLFLGGLLYYLRNSLGWTGLLLATIPLAWVHTYLRRFEQLHQTRERLDATNRELRERGQELEAGNRDLAEANVRLQAVNEDLQQTRRTLVQAEKLKAMGQMAGGVAHDFNNILGAIAARSELLQLEEGLSPTLRDGLAGIHRSALDGAAVVRRIQDFTRVREEQDFQRLELGQLAADTLDMTRALWRDAAHRQGLTYTVECDCPQPTPAWGNAAELREVLHNLVLNALDAMPSGGRLRLAARPVPDGAELVVEDSGSGIPAHVLEHVFDPFFTTKGARGNGLGLSVCLGIVERHHGSIQAQSVDGQGSRFTIRLPRPPADAPLEAPGEAAPARPMSGRPRSILVVDDEPEVRAVLVDTLRMMGHQVREASGGAEALSCMAEGRPELLFTDLGMPGMNGWELIQRTRAALGPEAPRVVLVTGWGGQLKPEDVQVHAVEHVLAKPFKLKELGELLARLETLGPAARGF